MEYTFMTLINTKKTKAKNIYVCGFQENVNFEIARIEMIIGEVLAYLVVVASFSVSSCCTSLLLHPK